MNKLKTLYGKAGGFIDTAMYNPAYVKLGLFIGMMVFALSTNALAEDPFAQTYTTVGDWVTGNLGLLMALITFIIAAMVSIGTRKLSPLGWGIVLAFVIGGLGGMATSFFDMGQAAFGTP